MSSIGQGGGKRRVCMALFVFSLAPRSLQMTPDYLLIVIGARRLGGYRIK
jgi:hypothetical protein